MPVSVLVIDDLWHWGCCAPEASRDRALNRTAVTETLERTRRGGERSRAENECAEGENTGRSSLPKAIFLYEIRVQGEPLLMRMQLLRHVAYQSVGEALSPIFQ